MNRTDESSCSPTARPRHSTNNVDGPLRGMSCSHGGILSGCHHTAMSTAPLLSTPASRHESASAFSPCVRLVPVHTSPFSSRFIHGTPAHVFRGFRESLLSHGLVTPQYEASPAWERPVTPHHTTTQHKVAAHRNALHPTQSQPSTPHPTTSHRTTQHRLLFSKHLAQLSGISFVLTTEAEDCSCCPVPRGSTNCSPQPESTFWAKILDRALFTASKFCLATFHRSPTHSLACQPNLLCHVMSPYRHTAANSCNSNTCSRPGSAVLPAWRCKVMEATDHADLVTSQGSRPLQLTAHNIKWLTPIHPPPRESTWHTASHQLRRAPSLAITSPRRWWCLSQ